ncbi:MAG: SAM-dependent methyltransferase [Planctomycetes bacterium]|nr:SAM-dependent methyltransferase [Planctomycetota bacterium]
MPPDFRDATERHWEDATCLRDNNRLANADYLFGLSAECALKALMLGLGMVLRPDGAPQDPKHRVHINNLWYEFIGFATGKGGARYAARLSGTSSPFNDWDVAQRYAHRNHVSATVVEQHCVGCDLTRQVLYAALLDGVV